MEQSTQVTIRKAPRFRSFFFLGTGLGIFVGLVIWLISLQANPTVTASILGYLVVVFGVLGAGLGVVAALLLDRLSRARSRTLEATKLIGSAPKRRSKPAPK